MRTSGSAVQRVRVISKNPSGTSPPQTPAPVGSNTNDAVSRANRTAVYIGRLGLVTSSVCCYLGFPCAGEEVFVEHLFRSTCGGYFLGNLVGLSLSTPSWKKRWFQFALVSNSLASWIVSKWWCLSFSDWCILMLLEHLFMLSATVLLVGDHVIGHMFFTFSGSVAGFVGRDEEDMAKRYAALVSSGGTLVSKVWIVCLVLVVSMFVGSICYSGYLTQGALRKRLDMLMEVLTMSEENITVAEERIGSQKLSGDTPPLSTNPSTQYTGTDAVSVRTDVPPICPIEQLVMHKAIGQGSFGRVYYGTLADSPVAVKIMSWNPSRKSKAPPIKEALMSTEFRHPNLVQSFQHCAVTVVEPIHAMDVSEADLENSFDVWLVQEWCDLGTVANYCDTPRSDARGLIEVYEMMADTCRGGAYLHQRGVVHGDLTGNNVLLKTHAPSPSGRGFVCKICDFGLARVLEGLNSALVTSQLGTVSHMPPELFTLDRDSMRFTKKVDIYSLGMLLWQAVEGDYPFRGHSVPQIIIAVSKGKRPKFTTELPDDLAGLFERCTSKDPSARPTFEELLRLFETLSGQ